MALACDNVLKKLYDGSDTGQLAGIFMERGPIGAVDGDVRHDAREFVVIAGDVVMQDAYASAGTYRFGLADGA